MEQESAFKPVVRALALQVQAGEQTFAAEDDIPSNEDKELLRRYVTGEVPRGSDAAKEVEDCVKSFRSWYRSYCDVIAQEIAK